MPVDPSQLFCVILKPDCCCVPTVDIEGQTDKSQNEWIKHNLVTNYGYTIKRSIVIDMTEEKAIALYGHHKVQDFYDDLIRDCL